MCLRLSENVQEVWPTAGFEPTTSGFITAMTCNIQETNDYVDLNSARRGQNEEREKISDYWIENFLFENIFHGKT